VRSPGTSWDSSAPVASPRASSARTVASSTSASHAPDPSPIPAAASTWTNLRRSLVAIPRVHAAWTTGASSVGTTKTVRRIPSSRISDRSSYSAPSMPAGSAAHVRAFTDRNTEAGSVLCSATRSRATSAAVAARVPLARRCRRPSLARRSSTLT
jgi:hypothetical protein